jgi:cell division protein ZapA
MAQVTIRINGYAYTVGCDDGQESHLLRMAESVEERINSIKALGGQSGESRLLVLAALLMADELHDQSIFLDKIKAELAQAAKPEAESRRRLARLADRAEDIASGLEQT